MPLNLDDLFVIARTSDGKNYKVTVAELLTLTSSGTITPVLTVPGIDGEDGEDGLTIPGKDGINGLPGIQGITGAEGKPVFLSIEAEEPDAPIMIPGPQGVIGVSGITGKDGQIIFGQDGEDGLDGFPGIQGVAGTQGVAGNPGATGPTGPMIWLPSYADEPEEPMCPAYPFLNNRVYLGEKTGAAVTVGPLSWNELFETIYWEYNIGGYNGGGPIGRFLCANGAISTIGLTNGNTLIENITLNQTSVSKPGIPLAVTASAIARSGWGVIRGLAGEFKQIDVSGMSGNPAVATAPTSFIGRSFFSDLGTNLLIKNIQLSVYDTLIATALSAQTFTAPTRIRAWGIRKQQQ